MSFSGVNRISLCLEIVFSFGWWFLKFNRGGTFTIQKSHRNFLLKMNSHSEVSRESGLAYFSAVQDCVLECFLICHDDHLSRHAGMSGRALALIHPAIRTISKYLVIIDLNDFEDISVFHQHTTCTSGTSSLSLYCRYLIEWGGSKGTIFQEKLPQHCQNCLFLIIFLGMTICENDRNKQAFRLKIYNIDSCLFH